VGFFPTWILAISTRRAGTGLCVGGEEWGLIEAQPDAPEAILADGEL